MRQGVERLQRHSIADGVFALLREQIINGDLAPGQKLTEQELGSSLGVSRTPVREALRLLLGEYLVEKRSTGGFNVTNVSVEDVIETYNVRALLEGLMARDATAKAAEEDFRILRKLLDDMRFVEEDSEAVAQISRRFHARIAAIASNRWAESALKQLNGQIDRYRALAAHGRRRPHESVAEHVEILDAMERGDALGAEVLMRRHVEASAGPAVDVIRKLLQSRGDGARR